MKQDKGTETRALETMSTEPPHPSTSPLRPPNSLPPSLLERYFARHEFSTPFLACCSDVEPLTVPELLEIAEGEGPGCGERGAAILGGLSLGYVDPRGSTRLREAVAREHGGGGEGGDGDAITADDVLVAAPQELAYLLQRSLLQGKGEEESERGGAKVATGQRAREGGHNVATGQRRKQRKKTHLTPFLLPFSPLPPPPSPPLSQQNAFPLLLLPPQRETPSSRSGRDTLDSPPSPRPSGPPSSLGCPAGRRRRRRGTAAAPAAAAAATAAAAPPPPPPMLPPLPLPVPLLLLLLLLRRCARASTSRRTSAPRSRGPRR